MSDSDLPSDLDSVFQAAPALLGPSWQEQDTILGDLWRQNKTPQEIADILGRSVAAIMTRAARLGLPRRSAPGRKAGSRRLSPEEGTTRPTTPRTSTARATQENGEEIAQASTRICLMCLKSFASLGRHNRICPSCKGSAEYITATSIADIHFPA